MDNLKWHRKTIQIKTTFYVAVPLPWAESNNLIKGKDILIEMNKDGSLRVSPEGVTND